MRPIDADALKKERIYIDGIPAVTECDIDNAPTIDTIPMEWLKTQINKALDDNETELASDIDWLIRRYIDEQEAR